MHNGDLESGKYEWYYPSPWVLFKLIKDNEERFHANYDCVGTSNVNVEEFVCMSADLILGDTSKWLKVPVASRGGRNASKINFERHVPFESQHITSVYPNYIKFNVRVSVENEM